MLSERITDGKGIHVSPEETETKEEMLGQIVLAAVKKAFAATGTAMPEDITEETVARFIFTGPLQQGKAIVKPFWIRGVCVPLFIKQTDSPTKIMIAPINGLCPGVIKSMVRDNIPEPMNPAAQIPFGSFPESLH